MIAIDLFGKNTNVDLSVMYKDFTNLKDDVKDLNVGFSKIKSLSSLSGDISNLSARLSDLNDSFTTLTDDILTRISPAISLNSSNIESLSSSVLSVKSSLSDLTSLSTLTSYSIDIENLKNETWDLKTNTMILNSALTSLTSLTSLTNDITSLTSNTRDLKYNTVILNNKLDDLKTLSSLSTLNGVYTAPSFNNQAFNTTFSLNSDMFFTGQFGLNSGTIDCSSGIWDLKELKPTTLSSITANSLSKLKMENFDLSYCDLSCNGNCSLEDCKLTHCQLTGNHAIFNNGFIENCWLNCRTYDFNNNMKFSGTITFINNANITFNNIDFYNSTDYKLYLSIDNTTRASLYVVISECVYGGYSWNSSFYKNFFTADDRVYSSLSVIRYGR